MNTVKPLPIATLMDLIAKAQFLPMDQYNGFCGCKDCLVKGCHVSTKKGYAHTYMYEDALLVKKTYYSFSSFIVSWEIRNRIFYLCYSIVLSPFKLGDWLPLI